MEEIKFKSITDLYKRVFPALTTKKVELAKEKISITELELWNYLKNNNWDKANNLSLAEMVNDILNLDIKNFLENKNS